MKIFLVKCINPIITCATEVGKIYHVEDIGNNVFKIIYDSKNGIEGHIIGNKNWFYDHFEPIKCNRCMSVPYCRHCKDSNGYTCSYFVEDN